jgi:hypothetical protein
LVYFSPFWFFGPRKIWQPRWRPLGKNFPHLFIFRRLIYVLPSHVCENFTHTYVQGILIWVTEQDSSHQTEITVAMTRILKKNSPR